MVRERRWHVLKQNKASQRPMQHLFADIECKVGSMDNPEQEHKLWFGWCCYWRRRPDRDKDTITYSRFTTAEQFWRIVLSHVENKRPLYLIAHNTSYDFGVMRIFEHLEQAGFEMYSVYLGNLSVIMRFRRDKQKIIVLDNCNYFSGSLASLGQAIGYPKMDVNPLTATEEEADPYCRRDVEIMVKLWQAYYEFLEDHDLGCWGTTVPSQAFRAYRHRFMRHKIVIHADADALALEREAYHGGRTSVFWTGRATGETFYKLDVNSMYPYVMSKETCPTRFYGTRKHITIEGLERKMRRFQVIARVTINTDVPVYPVMLDGHLVHPVGRFDTVLTTPEVRFAIEHDHLERVHIVGLYEHDDLFSDYVAFFYGLKTRYKQEDQGAFYLMAKLYLNALYGKFGQKAESWEPFDDQPPEVSECDYMVDHKTGERWRLYTFGGHCWRARSTGEANDSFPAIAAHVTAYARLYLWELITKAGREHVFYCDTDSLIVDSVGMDNVRDLLDTTALGALKIEEQADTIEIVCPKHYKLAGEWKRKGVPSKAIALGDNVFQCTQFPSFKTQGRSDRGSAYHTKTVIKHLTGNVSDGRVLADGWVKPLDAGEIMPDRYLDDAARARIEQIEAQADALQESLPLEAGTVFRLWDFRKGAFKQARAKRGALVPVEYSEWDAKATELGFDDLNGLQKAVGDYLGLRKRIQELNAEREEIMYPAPSMDTPGEMPW